MWIAVIPANNEAASIGTVIRNLALSRIDLLLLVANGCIDNTCQEALNANPVNKLKILHFNKPLGIDTPKAVGAIYAQRYHPKGILFVDGDMTGPLIPVFQNLIQTVEEGADIAITNCYPLNLQRSALAEQVLQAREHLNKKIGLFSELGAANPCHGPHAYSFSLLQKIDLVNLAIPPKALAQAATLNAKIKIGATIPHNLLGSPTRSPMHSERIAETIIADCEDALELLSPSAANHNAAAGYRDLRRFDIIERQIKMTAPL